MKRIFLLLKAVSFVYGSLWTNILLRLNGVKCSGIVRSFGVPIVEIRGGGRMSFGPRMILKSSQISSFMGLYAPCKFSALSENATLTVGADFQASACVICVRERVNIGSRVMLGANVTILDSDCHAMDIPARYDKSAPIPSAPVEIGDDVFVGTNSIILKGVKIGAGSIVAAGSVVVRSIPSNCLAGGNPAKVIKNMKG